MKPHSSRLIYKETTHKRSPTSYSHHQNCFRHYNSTTKTHPFHYSRNICFSQLKFPTHIDYISFHKTGTVLSNQFQQLFLQYCNISSETNNEIRWFIRTNAIRFQKRSRKLILLFIRDPLSTIISGYNYHKSGTEVWTHLNMTNKLMSISKKFTMKSDFNYRLIASFNQTYDVKLESFWQLVESIEKQNDTKMNQLNITSSVYNDIFNNNAVLKKLVLDYNTDYVLSNQISIKLWYSINVDMIFWEFIRYIKRVFVHEYNIYSFVLKYNESGLNVHIFRMESLFTKFNQTMNTFLNTKLFGSTVKNDMQSNYEYLIQEKERLFDLLHILSIDDSRNNHRKHIHVNISNGGKDSSEIMFQKLHLLKIDVVICKIIKLTTLMLDYTWMFSHNC